jgi:hypothetical protein
MVIPGLAVALILAVAAAGCSPAPAAPAAVRSRHPAPAARPAARRTASPSTAIAPDPADAKACGSLPSFPAGTAAQIMAGRLTIAPFKAVTVDPNGPRFHYLDQVPTSATPRPGTSVSAAAPRG